MRYEEEFLIVQFPTLPLPDDYWYWVQNDVLDKILGLELNKKLQQMTEKEI
jgi:hypothetical protein